MSAFDAIFLDVLARLSGMNRPESPILLGKRIANLADERRAILQKL